MPEGDFINTLPNNSILFTFEDRRYIVPRKIITADHPLFKELYNEDTSLDYAIKIFKLNNITHIYNNGVFDHHPLFTKSVINKNLKNEDVFELVYKYDKTEIYRIK